MAIEIPMITVTATISAGVDKVWKYWSAPEHIMQWNHATDDWISPRAENDLRDGGQFNIRMEAKDGSQGFDFSGTYDLVEPGRYIQYTMGDGRKVEVRFEKVGDHQTRIIESFEAEATSSTEMQQQGWQMILDNFKQYVESH